VTLTDLRALVERRREELARFDARVDGAALCDEILAALRGIAEPVEPLYTLRDAAALCG
jgi:anti-sigma-K factor RskA